MLGPGGYRADRTKGITRVEDLPKAKVVHRRRHRLAASRLQVLALLHDLGNLVVAVDAARFGMNLLNGLRSAALAGRHRIDFLRPIFASWRFVLRGILVASMGFAKRKVVIAISAAPSHLVR